MSNCRSNISGHGKMEATPNRQRDLFPLPLPSHSIVDGDLSRSVRRRLHRKSHNVSWLTEGIQSLNELSGAPYRRSAVPRVCVSAAQLEATKLLSNSYMKVPAPPVSMCPAGAFKELCGSSSRYTPSCSGKTVSYSRERISWPRECSSPVCMRTVLEGRELDFVANWETRLLRDPVQRSEVAANPEQCKLYLEPTLIRKSSTYADFLNMLSARGMLAFRRGGSHCWAFSSWRKSLANCASSSILVALTSILFQRPTRAFLLLPHFVTSSTKLMNVNIFPEGI